MNNENEVMEKAPVLTKKDCVKGAIRWSLMAVTTFNYDTQLAPAVVFGIGPLLRKIYKDDDEYVEALNNHYKYFNTMPWLANIVLGATLALEDKEGITSLDAVQNIKVSLMGPLAGIGDTFILDTASYYHGLHRRIYGSGRQPYRCYPVAHCKPYLHLHPYPVNVDRIP